MNLFFLLYYFRFLTEFFYFGQEIVVEVIIINFNYYAAYNKLFTRLFNLRKK